MRMQKTSTGGHHEQKCSEHPAKWRSAFLAGLYRGWRRLLRLSQCSGKPLRCLSHPALREQSIDCVCIGLFQSHPFDDFLLFLSGWCPQSGLTSYVSKLLRHARLVGGTRFCCQFDTFSAGGILLNLFIPRCAFDHCDNKDNHFQLRLSLRFEAAQSRKYRLIRLW